MYRVMNEFPSFGVMGDEQYLQSAFKKIEIVLLDQGIQFMNYTLFRETYLPIVTYIYNSVKSMDHVPVVGVNGSQGSGKSTFCEITRLILKEVFDLQGCSLSIDDFYHTKDKRNELGETVSSLLKVRGVPGTHDIGLAVQTIQKLQASKTNNQTAVVRFHKQVDDRAPEEHWMQFEGRPDIIFLEGWCVGCPPLQKSEMEEPINTLEAKEDANGAWRNFMYEKLQNEYGTLFEMIDYMVFLKIPSFAKVKEWRWQQEQQLLKQCLKRGLDTSAVMSQEEVERFTQFYERLTIYMLAELDSVADLTLNVNEMHQIDAFRIKK